MHQDEKMDVILSFIIIETSVLCKSWIKLMWDFGSRLAIPFVKIYICIVDRLKIRWAQTVESRKSWKWRNLAQELAFSRFIYYAYYNICNFSMKCWNK